jgi:hypothetical protein
MDIDDVLDFNFSKYIDNIRQMSNYINDYIKMPEIKDIVSTTKFALKGHEFSGKVDSHTLGVVDKSLSYAVIYKKQIKRIFHYL